MAKYQSNIIVHDGEDCTSRRVMSALEGDLRIEFIEASPIPNPNERTYYSSPSEGREVTMDTGPFVYLSPEDILVSLRKRETYKSNGDFFEKTEEGLIIRLASNHTPVQDLSERIKSISPENIKVTER